MLSISCADKKRDAVTNIPLACTVSLARGLTPQRGQLIALRLQVCTHHFFVHLPGGRQRNRVNKQDLVWQLPLGKGSLAVLQNRLLADFFAGI